MDACKQHRWVARERMLFRDLRLTKFAIAASKLPYVPATIEVAKNNRRIVDKRTRDDTLERCAVALWEAQVDFADRRVSADGRVGGGG
jgi:hypothetical protein